MNAKHTPDYAPYEIHSRTDCWTLETSNGKVVCSLDKDQGLNARYIVHCVNMHNDLIKALEDILALSKEMDLTNEENPIINNIEYLLQKAKE